MVAKRDAPDVTCDDVLTFTDRNSDCTSPSDIFPSPTSALDMPPQPAYSSSDTMAQSNEMQIDVPEPVVLQQQSLGSGQLMPPFYISDALPPILTRLHSNNFKSRSHSARNPAIRCKIHPSRFKSNFVNSKTIAQGPRRTFCDQISSRSTKLRRKRQDHKWSEEAQARLE